MIFYEPVSSEIRTIQRRGRTGRKRLGEVIVLIAEGTRDEGAKAAALRREENMQRAVHRVSRSLPRTHHSDLSNLTGFSVVSEGVMIDSVDFVKTQREEGDQLYWRRMIRFPGLKSRILKDYPQSR